MAPKVSEVMTPAPVTVMPGLSVRATAQAMRDCGASAVLVMKDGGITGLVTDRDIVVRATAEGWDPGSTPVSEVCSNASLVTASPGEDADVAVRRMREHGTRRIPVVEGEDHVVGVLSIHDVELLPSMPPSVQ